MSYETLDKIADSYIPLLLIIFLLGFIYRVYVDWPKYKPSLAMFGFAVALLVVAYGIMFIDNALNLWPALGLDYSTHTAVSLALVYALCFLFSKSWKHAWKILCMSFLAYAALMLYQRYHSLADILTTAVVLSAISFLIYKLLLQRKK